MEVLSWACSVTSSVIFAVSAPNIPVVPLYCVFITGCLASLWSCWTRGSFGLVLNYFFIISIDLIGLGKMMLL